MTVLASLLGLHPHGCGPFFLSRRQPLPHQLGLPSHGAALASSCGCSPCFFCSGASSRHNLRAGRPVPPRRRFHLARLGAAQRGYISFDTHGCSPRARCPRPPAGGTPFGVPAKGVGWRGRPFVFTLSFGATSTPLAVALSTTPRGAILTFALPLGVLPGGTFGWLQRTRVARRLASSRPNSRTPSGGGQTRAGGGPRSAPRPPPAPQSGQSGTVCKNYNAGTCTRSPCPNGFAHRCAICNKSGHPAWDCYSASPAQKDQYPHKGKSKGKGKQRKAS